MRGGYLKSIQRRPSYPSIPHNHCQPRYNLSIGDYLTVSPDMSSIVTRAEVYACKHHIANRPRWLHPTAVRYINVSISIVHTCQILSRRAVDIIRYSVCAN
jgi:hypothetical protein